MAGDLVRDFGYLTLGSRLKRLGERMQSDVSRLLKAEGIEIPAALLPTLGTLDRHGEQTVNELAKSLGIAQPGVTRNLTQLEKAGLIQRGTPARDQRVRPVALSEEGARLADDLKRTVWPRVEAAVAEICAGLDGPLLEQLTTIEEALDQRPLDQRAKQERDR